MNQFDNFNRGWAYGCYSGYTQALIDYDIPNGEVPDYVFADMAHSDFRTITNKTTGESTRAVKVLDHNIQYIAKECNGEYVDNNGNPYIHFENSDAHIMDWCILCDGKYVGVPREKRYADYD